MIKFRHLIAGVDTLVPLSNGLYLPEVNFDNAASTPVFYSVLNEIVNFSSYYSSIHRGVGYKSVVSSDFYEQARLEVLHFVNGNPKHDTVIFVKNTTEAINKLANRIDCSEKNIVLSTVMEHHSNDLPWRKRFRVVYVNIDKHGRLDLADLKAKLIQYQGRVRLVSVTGASNVTGYVNPIYDIAELAHRFQAEIFVDAAQLAPHYPINMQSVGSGRHIDYLAFSAHKMYAPFGTGVLICPAKTFMEGEPDHVGGGTVDFVSPDRVLWKEPPHKEEAGTPNVMGVVALVTAIRVLNHLGFPEIVAQERSLTQYALSQLSKLPIVQIYIQPDDCQSHIGIIPFNIKGMSHSKVSRILGDWGIAVRNGCFCAQPYIHRLLGISQEQLEYHYRNPHVERPGLVRISFGLYNDYTEIDRMIRVLWEIAKQI